MSRPRKTTRGQKIAEGLPFTPEAVAHILAEACVEATIDPEKLAQLLNNWRWLANAERAVVPFKRAHKRFAELLNELHRDIVPVLRQQTIDLAAMAAELVGSTAEASFPSQAEAFEGAVALDQLKRAIERCGQSAVLLHRETRVSGVTAWQDFAATIEQLLVNEGASRRAAWRVVRAVTPGLTGEAAPSVDAVETLLKRQRLPGRARRAL